MHSIEEIVSRQINRWNHLTHLLKYVPGEGDKATETPVSASLPTICISREMGSGARVIAQAVCDRLGYEFFGSSIIDAIAKDMKVQRQLVDSLDEWGRGELELMVESFLRGREFEGREYIRSLFRVIKTMAMKGGVVMLGRGATYILKDQAALNVLVIAPLARRIQLMMQYHQIDEKAARETILLYDRQREHFIHHFFGENIHNSVHFDLTINTGRMEPAAGARLVLATLEARGYNLDQISLVSALK